MTGLKGGAVGLGRKVDAFTFSLNAAEVEDVTELVGDDGGGKDEEPLSAWMLEGP